MCAYVFVFHVMEPIFASESREGFSEMGFLIETEDFFSGA